MMNIAIAQSGGPTCAINASLVGAFREALKEPDIDAIFGSVNGIEGLIENRLIDLKEMIRTTKDIELLRQTPSTVLGSCRYGFKVLGNGDLTKNLTVKATAFSESAKTKIEAAGGKAEVV